MCAQKRSRNLQMPAAFRFHYEKQAKEETRTHTGRSVIEFERQKDILQRFLPRPPARLLDIGGGPGAYSLWLSSQGYEVHLLDAMEGHVRQAVRGAQKRKLLLDARTGDARSLPYPDGYADVVLLMGPLYHLTGSGDRATALLEARRVLRPKGILFTVGISRFTSMLDGSWQGFIEDPGFRKIIGRDLRSGQHRNPKRKEAYFTTAYFHHPEELREEIHQAGFRGIRLFASEGFLWWMPDVLEYWKNPAHRSFLLKLLRAVEEEPSLMGLGPHILAMGRK